MQGRLYDLQSLLPQQEIFILFPCALIHVKVAVELGPSYEVVIAGRPGAADTERLAGALRRSFQPNRVLLLSLLDGGGLRRRSRPAVFDKLLLFQHK
jgi:hypothetical protein